MGGGSSSSTKKTTEIEKTISNTLKDVNFGATGEGAGEIIESGAGVLKKGFNTVEELAKQQGEATEDVSESVKQQSEQAQQTVRATGQQAQQAVRSTGGGPASFFDSEFAKSALPIILLIGGFFSLGVFQE